MKIIIQYTAVFLAGLLCLSLAGCEKNKDESASLTSVTDNTEASGAESATKSAAADKTPTAENTESVTEITEKQTEPVTEPEPEKGFANGFEAAEAYYNAYLNGDAEAVYEMFCDEEISAYNTFLEETDLFNGKNPRSILKKSAIIGAISDSMLNINSIMEEYSENDTWTVTLTEEDLTEISEEDLAEFNDSLGTSFTNGLDCGYVFYVNSDGEQSFVGNGCAFVEYEGRWYLSYSTVINAELITYLDISSLYDNGGE